MTKVNAYQRSVRKKNKESITKELSTRVIVFCQTQNAIAPIVGMT